MAYELNASRNVLEIQDRLAGCVLEFYYRMPTNAMRTQWDNLITVRKGSRVIVKKDHQILQARFGAKLLTGFKKGIFSVDGAVIASDPDDPAYYKDWKNLIFRVRLDLLAYAARTIMASAVPLDAGIEYEEDDDAGLIEDLDDPNFDFDEGADDQAAASAPEATTDPLSGQ
jgi:hypothetical protein